jgi:phosphatidylglycerophosphate synthase
MFYSLRKNVNGFLNACAKIINIIPFITPNRLTLLSIPAAFIAAYFLFQNDFSSAIIFVFLAFFIDALDGALARLQNKKSPFGNYLDAIVDRIVEASIFLGLAFLFPLTSLIAFALSAGITNIKALFGTVKDSDNKDWPGIGGRPDRLVLLFVGMIVTIFIPTTFGFHTMELFLFILILMNIIAIFQRLSFVAKLISSNN